MNRKTLQWSGSVLALFIIGGLYFVCYTPAGLNWIINNKLKTQNSSIQIDTITFHWFESVNIDNLTYANPWIKAHLQDVTVSWNPLQIFGDQLELTDIHASKFHIIQLDTAGDIQSDSGIGNLALKIDNGSIQSLLITTAEQKQYSVGNINFSELFINKIAQFRDLKFQSSNGYIHANGRIGFERDSIINLSTKAHLKASNFPVLNIHGTLVGTPLHLRFLQQTDAPYNLLINGNIKNLYHEPSIELESDLVNTDLSKILSDNQLMRISGKIKGTGPMSALVVNADLEMNDSFDHRWHSVINGSLTGSQLKFTMNTQLKVPTADSNATKNIIVAGNYDIDKDKSFTRSLTFKANWEQLTWPSHGPAVLVSSEGSLDFSGDTMKFSLKTPDLYYSPLGSKLNAVNISSDGLKNNKVSFNFKAQTESGKLVIRSDLAESTDKNLLLQKLWLKGSNFPLFKMFNSELLISPEIKFARNQTGWTSEGILKVPSASIHLDNLNALTGFLQSIKNLSPGKDTGMQQRQLTMTIELGDSVWFKGYGLNANVNGQLSVTETHNKILIADGKLNVVRGNYHIGKRRVPLMSGVLTFDNLPLDNPQVDLNVLLNSAKLAETELISGRLKALYDQQKQTRPVIPNSGKKSLLAQNANRY